MNKIHLGIFLVGVYDMSYHLDEYFSIVLKEVKGVRNLLCYEVGKYQLILMKGNALIPILRKKIIFVLKITKNNERTRGVIVKGNINSRYQQRW